MNLTQAQMSALAADIVSVFGAIAHNSDTAQSVADYYNAVVDTTHWVWKTSLVVQDVYERVSPSATVWDFTLYAGTATAGQRDAWRDFTHALKFNPSLPQVRTAVAAILSGAGLANLRAHLVAMALRNPSRIEALLKVNDGTGGTATAADAWTMGAEGPLLPGDILQKGVWGV